MALPTFVTRTYTGAAKPLALTQPLDSSTTDFIYVSDLSGNGWSGLVTAGTLFCVVVNYNESTEEKILCSGVDLVNNILTIYNNGTENGRGYDGTTAQTHAVPTSATGNVFPVFTAQEAEEANRAAVAVGQIANNTGSVTAPSNISLSASSVGSSQYVAAADHTHKLLPADAATGLTNQMKSAIIRVYSSNTGLTTAGANTDTGTTIPFNTTAEYANGFLSTSLNTSTGAITIPVTGYYQVSGVLTATTSNAGTLNITVSVNGTGTAWGSVLPCTGTFTGSTISTILHLSANDLVTMGIRRSSTSTAALTNANTFLNNSFAISFVSA